MLKKIFKLFLVLFAVLVFLCVVVFVIPSLRPDIPPPDDSHLKVEIPDIPEEENAYNVIFESVANLDREAKNELEIFSNESIYDVPPETIERLMSKYSDRLKLLEKASTLSHSFAPIGVRDYITDKSSEKDDDGSLPDELYIGYLVKILVADAYHRFSLDDFKESTIRFSRIVQLSYRIRESAEIISYSLGTSVKCSVLYALNMLVSKHEIPHGRMFEWINSVGDYMKNDEDFKLSFKKEYQWQIQMMEKTFNDFTEKTIKEEKMSKEKLLKYTNVWFKYNRTKKEIIDHYTAMLLNVDRNFSKMDFSMPCNIGDNSVFLSFVKTWFTTGNVVGEVWCDTFTFGVYYYAFLHVRFGDLLVDGLRIRLALLAYEKQNGVLPDSLDELVPEFLSEIPEDPFDGKQIRYDREKGIIYSVGENLVDDGGEAKIFVFDDADFNKKKAEKDYVISIH
ncbi:MAG: hypothetical protein ABIH66_01800 [bacterium]